jgi:signal transduction histidine kinase
MLYVLQFEDGAQLRQMPLADGTAAALERALLAIGEQSRTAELTSAIVCDPALAVWTALVAQRLNGTVIATAADAAFWLGNGLVEKLAAGTISPEDAQLGRVPATDVEPVATLYASVVSAARTKHAADDADADLARSAVYWSAVTAASHKLLAAWPAEVKAERRLLPAFPPAVQPQPQSSYDLGKASGDELARFFLAIEPGIERRLPALLARLCHCERQLVDFDRRLEQEKLAALKELAYGAGHEINNPLANIAARAQTLAQDEADPERRRKLVAIHRQAMRAHEMIADLMLFARPPALSLAPCDLRSLAGQVVAELGDLAKERQIQLECGADQPAIMLEADQTQLAAALQAVVVNAMEAVGAGGHVEVLARQQSAGGEHWAELVVRDDGPGVSDDVRQHMFDPFFSGREAGRGLGFGLSKCWRIVTDHGGQVVVGSSPRGGCELTILLPRARETAIANHDG